MGELAKHEIAGDHQFGKAVRFLEDGGTDRNLFAERLGIKVDYADWLLNHARKMKRGTIRVVVSEKNDGRETAATRLTTTDTFWTTTSPLRLGTMWKR